MSTNAENDRGIKLLADALASHDWMATTTALDVLAQNLSDGALAHEFSEVSRVGDLINHYSKRYLLSKDCTLEIGRTLARSTQLSRAEILKVSQPAAFQILVTRFPKYETLLESFLFYNELLKMGRIDLCRTFFTPQDAEDITGIGVAVSSGTPQQKSRDHQSGRNMVNLSLASIVECYRAKEPPEQYWVDLVEQDGDGFAHSVWQSGNGADIVLALQALGLQEKSLLAAKVVLDRPMENDVDHLYKLALCGVKLNSKEKFDLLTNSKTALSKHSFDKERLFTLISSMMSLDFMEQGDYAFTHAIAKLPEKEFDGSLAFACNHLWETCDKEAKDRLLSLMNETYSTIDRAKYIKPLLTESLFKHLMLGREMTFAEDLGL